jgi:hypothetical protein
MKEKEKKRDKNNSKGRLGYQKWVQHQNETNLPD